VDLGGILVGGAHGDLTTVGINHEIGGMGKRWALLDVVVADELEIVVLREDGRLVIDGTVFEVEDGTRGDAGAVDGTSDVAGRDDAPVVVAHLDEAMKRALRVANWHRVSM
jgi:hypothetical protein